jgi:hypothetical protein
VAKLQDDILRLRIDTGTKQFFQKYCDKKNEKSTAPITMAGMLKAYILWLKSGCRGKAPR